MIELREMDTARAILRQTQVMGVMKQEQPERYLRLEHLLVRTYFDPNEVWSTLQCNCLTYWLLFQLLYRISYGIYISSCILVAFTNAQCFNLHVDMLEYGLNFSYGPSISLLSRCYFKLGKLTENVSLGLGFICYFKYQCDVY